MRRWLDLPEINVAVFSFLLNFVWEMWQVPLFREMPAMPHWEAVRTCTWATVGDVTISLAAFWAGAAAAHSRLWILRPTLKPMALYISAGVVITMVSEALATGPATRWAYAPAMPQLPIVSTGLAPFLQWVLLPPLILFFVRRQIREG